MPDELEASVTRGQQQASTKTIYLMAIEIYNNNDEHNQGHGVQDSGGQRSWWSYPMSRGLVASQILSIFAIVLIYVLMIQNNDGLPSDALNITPQL